MAFKLFSVVDKLDKYAYIRAGKRESNTIFKIGWEPITPFEIEIRVSSRDDKFTLLSHS